MFTTLIQTRTNGTILETFFKMIQRFHNFNENKKPKLQPSESETQYKWTQKAYAFLQEKGVELDSDHVEDAWDKLTMFEIVKVLNGNAIESPPYDKHNLVDYLLSRLQQDFELLEGSSHSIDTWDTYRLYVPKDDPNSEKALMVISKRGTGSMSYIFRTVLYEKIMVVTHKVTKFL